QTDIARRILLRLISFGEGRSDTRRQQPRKQLWAAGEAAADFAFVLQAMIDHRLLTVDEDVVGEPRVDLAHEIMISAWPTLVGWIQSHRADEQRRRQLEAAAAQWVARGRGANGLLDPIELADAEKWQRTESAMQLGRSTEVLALLAASRAAPARQRRRGRVIRAGIASGVTTFVVVIAVLGLIAHWEANNAREQASNAYAQTARAEASDRESKKHLKRAIANSLAAQAAAVGTKRHLLTRSA